MSNRNIVYHPRDTGSGKIRVKLIGDSTIGGNDYAFRLYNYDIDGCIIKPEHERFIRHYALETIRLKLLVTPDAPIVVQGYSSHTGGMAHNRQLAFDRADYLKMWLMRYGSFSFRRMSVVVATWQNDDAASAWRDVYERGNELEYMRATQVLVGNRDDAPVQIPIL